MLTDDLRFKSHLAARKVIFLYHMMRSITAARNSLRTGINFQETVYLTKKLQARDFKKSGYDEDSIMEYPYVLQYADLKNLSLRQAADDILFMSRLADDLLAKTELLRLRYWSRVREATHPDELVKIESDFMQDCFVNAQI